MAERKNTYFTTGVGIITDKNISILTPWTINSNSWALNVAYWIAISNTICVAACWHYKMVISVIFPCFGQIFSQLALVVKYGSCLSATKVTVVDDSYYSADNASTSACAAEHNPPGKLHTCGWYYITPRDKMTAIMQTIFLTYIFFNEKGWISIKFHWSLFPVENKSALIRRMAWRRTGDKPLSETMMILFIDAYIHRSTSKSQLVRWAMSVAISSLTANMSNMVRMMDWWTQPWR